MPAKTLKLGLHGLGYRDAIALQDVAVEATAGVPTAWRVLAIGPLTLMQGGAEMNLQVTAEDVAEIVAYHTAKGVRIPVDSRHYTFLLAQEFRVDESDLAEQLRGAIPAMGFGRLEARADGLWIVDVQWEPLALKLMGQGVFRYFSPVIRGFKDGRLRVTSVAMTNNPAINNLDALAASDDLDEVPRVGAVALKAINKKGGAMNKSLLGAIAALVGFDAVALTADGAQIPEDLAEKVKLAATELNGLRQVRKDVRDALALSAESADAAIGGLVASLKAQAAESASLKSKVDALALESETRKKSELIAQGKATGKLTPAHDAWLAKIDSIALSEFLAAAPVIIQPGSQVQPLKRQGDVSGPGGSDAMALSDDDKACLNRLGIGHLAADIDAARASGTKK